MFSMNELGLFALAALALVLTPGPNMIYCVSRTLCQGRAAGMVSLVGVLAGFVVHLLAASVGLTALLMAVPLAFDVIKLVGAAYLLWLAWQAIKPGGAAPFEAKQLPHDSKTTLFRMGFITNVLNPKVAMFYVAFFPQFIHLERGSVFLQSLTLGAVQITVSGAVNALIIVGAAGLTRFLSQSPAWIRGQRIFMGTVLAALALRIALQERK
jgi:threonine/homoserine/homoserine lactone efflux protein